MVREDGSSKMSGEMYTAGALDNSAYVVELCARGADHPGMGQLGMAACPIALTCCELQTNVVARVK